MSYNLEEHKKILRLWNDIRDGKSELTINAQFCIVLSAIDDLMISERTRCEREERARDILSGEEDKGNEE
jgi:hypothetical protein